MSWNEPFHFNVCNDENLSIKQISEVAQEALGIDAVTLWESHKPNGQHRKDASSSRFLHHYPDFHFTPLKEGIRTTYRKKFKL
jgi:nucleoside-diphosphate-sugar epimerase